MYLIFLLCANIKLLVHKLSVMVDNWFPKEHIKHFGVACGPFNVSYKNRACKMRARVLKRSGLIIFFVCEKGLVHMYQNHFSA